MPSRRRVRSVQGLKPILLGVGEVGPVLAPGSGIAGAGGPATATASLSPGKLANFDQSGI